MHTAPSRQLDFWAATVYVQGVMQCLLPLCFCDHSLTVIVMDTSISGIALYNSVDMLNMCKAQDFLFESFIP